MTNTTQRILTGLVGAPVLLGVCYVGGPAFGLLTAALALAGQHELYRMARASGVKPLVGPGLALGLLLAVAPLAPAALPVLGAGLALLTLAPLGMPDGAERPLERLAVTVFGLAYPVLGFAALGALRLPGAAGPTDGQAFGLTLAVFLLIWATDTAAYVVGRAIGRRPLAPTVSPKKTVEGAVGGVLGAALTAAALHLAAPSLLPPVHLAALALICGVVSQLGDLAESRLKRAAGIKDSGALLPGHGGVLDRFDALIVAAPLVYLYLRFAAGWWATG